MNSQKLANLLGLTEEKLEANSLGQFRSLSDAAVETAAFQSDFGDLDDWSMSYVDVDTWAKDNIDTGSPSGNAYFWDAESGTLFITH